MANLDGPCLNKRHKLIKKDDVVVLCCSRNSETRRHNENESGGFPQIVKADILFAYLRFLQQTSASRHFFQVRFIRYLC